MDFRAIRIPCTPIWGILGIFNKSKSLKAWGVFWFGFWLFQGGFG